MFVVAVTGKPLIESMAAVGLLVSNFRRFKGRLPVLFMDSRSNGDPSATTSHLRPKHVNREAKFEPDPSEFSVP